MNRNLIARRKLKRENLLKVKAGLLLGLCLLCSWVVAAPSLIPAAPSLSAKAYYLIDTLSGEVIVANNADEKLGPASLTKMMTSYVLSYELAQGNVQKSDMVTVSKNAWAQNFPGSSLMWIEVGKQVSVSDLHKVS
jgi:D-alanyl-D-alanine carboxypeptidase (penicillin-binding protein 5/6)